MNSCESLLQIKRMDYDKRVDKKWRISWMIQKLIYHLCRYSSCYSLMMKATLKFSSSAEDARWSSCKTKRNAKRIRKSKKKNTTAAMNSQFFFLSMVFIALDIDNFNMLIALLDISLLSATPQTVRHRHDWVQRVCNGAAASSRPITCPCAPVGPVMWPVIRVVDVSHERWAGCGGSADAIRKLASEAQDPTGLEQLGVRAGTT